MNDTLRNPAAADPSRLMELSTAYWGSQVFLTANRIGLFGHLADQEMTAEEVASGLGLDPRGVRLLLDACAGLGLLECEDGGYRNSAACRAFLVPGSPGFMGNAISFSDDLYATWGRLEDSLREGRPMLQAETYLGSDPETTRHFVYGMHDRALGIGRALVHLVDLGGRRRLLDVGGGPGTYAAMFAQRNPDLTARVLELPGVAAVAREILATLPGGDRVTMIDGSYLESEFPGDVDVVLMSGMFHRETPDTCRSLIRKAHASLGPDGLIIVSDVFTDAQRSHPVFAALFGLSMYLTAPDGGVHSDSDVAEWLRGAGFTDVNKIPFPPPMPHRVVTGVKP